MYKEILINCKYLNIPIKNDSNKCTMRFLCNDKIEREFEIELADEKPDFWVFTDVSELKGQTIKIVVDGFDGNVNSLNQIEQGNDVIGGENIYYEKFRPQFHFSTKRGWINDPNGLLYYKGEYHLFYQHNPYGYKWGNLHWGHAVSKDFIHWEEIGDALYPDEMGTMFSGSGVVDENNTTGFRNGDESPLILIYTAAGGKSLLSRDKQFTQCIAYSNDLGRTWTKYSGNPILSNIISENRDPKVIWHEQTKKWVMALYLDNYDYALFFSRDIKEWHRLCDVQVPGSSECPDIFELPVDGDPQNIKTVFWTAHGKYIIGNFDGYAFTSESEVLDFYFGNCSYAAQTWSNMQEENSRIQIAWCTQDLPQMPFNQFLTFPCELTLRSTEEGIRLFSNPIKEIEKLHSKKHFWKSLILKEGENSFDDITGELFDIRAEIDTGTAEDICISIRGVEVVYKVKEQTINCLDKTAYLNADNGRISLQMLVDRASIEIFGNQGRVYMPIGVIPEDRNRSVGMNVKGGKATIHCLEVYELKSIWSCKDMSANSEIAIP